MTTITTEMSFLEPWVTKKEGPYLRGICTDEYPRTNFENHDNTVIVRDARPRKMFFDLDTHGFAYANDESITDQIVDAIRQRNSKVVAKLYYQHIEELVRQKTGASRVIIFDHTYRKKDPSMNPRDNPNGKEQPATVVHCDQSARGAIARIRRHAGDDAERLLQGRAQILNIWRPIQGTVEDWGLATMDYRSLSRSSIHPTTLYRQEKEFMGETVSFEHAQNQQWWHLNRQQVDEVTFVKIWDSRDDVARLCPHCAFPDPNAPADAKPRESIEVRCLVFYEAEKPQ